MPDARDSSVPDEHHVHRVSNGACVALADIQTGHWLSQDKRHHHKFLHDTIEHVDANPKELDPTLVEFQEMVEKDTRLYMLFEMMFQQAS